MMTWMDKYWTTCSKNQSIIIKHERLGGWLKEKLDEIRRMRNPNATIMRDI